MNQQQKGVHYFPGHMKKALNTLSNFLNAVDLIVEVADSRAPFSSRNPLLNDLAPNKPRLLFLTKLDRADSSLTNAWISFYKEKGLKAVACNLKKERAMTIISKECESLVKAKREKEKRIGMKPQPIRLLVAGVPNVGKSTLINNLAGRSIAIAGNKPGVTRAEQWIKLSSGFILLDTPGILPMNYGDHMEAVRLALTGSIKEEVLPIDDLARTLLDYLRRYYQQILAERYDIPSLESLSDDEIFIKMGQKRGFLLKGGEVDLDKSASLLVKEFRDGELGRVTLEVPNA